MVDLVDDIARNALTSQVLSFHNSLLSFSVHWIQIKEGSVETREIWLNVAINIWLIILCISFGSNYHKHSTVQKNFIKLNYFRERILKTIKPRNKNLIKNIIVFLLNNCIWTNRKVETKLYLLPVGPNKIVQQENNNILDEILVL